MRGQAAPGPMLELCRVVLGLILLPPPGPWLCRSEALSGSGALGRGEAPGGRILVDASHVSTSSSLRDIAKNALLRWRAFIYWTLLGLFDALVFFFGAYFMFENTTVTSNGQVREGLGRGDGAAGSGGEARDGPRVGVWVSAADGADPMAGLCRLQGHPLGVGGVQPL